MYSYRLSVKQTKIYFIFLQAGITCNNLVAHYLFYCVFCFNSICSFWQQRYTIIIQVLSLLSVCSEMEELDIYKIFVIIGSSISLIWKQINMRGKTSSNSLQNRLSDLNLLHQKFVKIVTTNLISANFMNLSRNMPAVCLKFIILNMSVL